MGKENKPEKDDEIRIKDGIGESSENKSGDAVDGIKGGGGGGGDGGEKPPKMPPVPELPPDLILQIPQDNYIRYMYELFLISYLDKAAHEPFELAFENAEYIQFKKAIDIIFRLDERNFVPGLMRRSVKEEFELNRIDAAVDAVKSKVEEICRRNNINEPVRLKIMKVGQIFRCIPLILLMFIFIMSPDLLTLSIIFGGSLATTLIPMIYFRRVISRWNEFAYRNMPEVREEVGEELARIRDFVQFLIDDCREFMLNMNIPLQVSSGLKLYSKDYLNIEVVKEEVENQKQVYYVRFAYPPEYVKLPDVKKTVTHSVEGYGKCYFSDSNGNFVDVLGESLPEWVIGSGAAGEGGGEGPKTPELFIICPSPKISGEKLTSFGPYRYSVTNEISMIESLLSEADFMEIAEPEKYISKFPNPEGILCDCGEPVTLDRLMVASFTAPIRFEIYTAIGKKCRKCGKTAIIIYPADPDNIPEELSELFRTDEKLV